MMVPQAAWIMLTKTGTADKDKTVLYLRRLCVDAGGSYSHPCWPEIVYATTEQVKHSTEMARKRWSLGDVWEVAQISMGLIGPLTGRVSKINIGLVSIPLNGRCTHPNIALNDHLTLKSEMSVCQVHVSSNGAKNSRISTKLQFCTFAFRASNTRYFLICITLVVLKYVRYVQCTNHRSVELILESI